MSLTIVAAVIVVLEKIVEQKQENPAGNLQGLRKNWFATTADLKQDTQVKFWYITLTVTWTTSVLKI
jgi:hypothetical protein